MDENLATREGRYAYARETREMVEAMWPLVWQFWRFREWRRMNRLVRHRISVLHKAQAAYGVTQQQQSGG